ncbi:MAG: hypothetical protein KDE28_12410, partial [Anaerolineales bacterium]|nr:hypothetical protein [Anaerolineales bacterium]
QPAEAIHHALAAPDLARAAALIEQAWRSADRRFQGGTWLAWAQQLPAALVRERPVLSVGCAWALLDTGQVEAAEPYLEDAEHWLAPDADRTGMKVTASAEFAALPGIIASARAQLAQARRDGPATAHYARRALALIPADDPFYRTIPSIILGLAQWESGDLGAAEAAFAEAQATFAQVGNEFFYLSSSAVLGEIRLAQGRLTAAETTFRDAMAWAEQQGEPLTLATAKLLRGLSKVQLARHELEAMAETLARCQSMRAHGILVGSVHRVHVGYARLSLALGKLDEALDHLDQAEQTSLWDRLPTLWPIDALRALIWLRQGHWSEAERWAASEAIEPAGPIPYAQEFAGLTQARILLAAYDRTREPEALAAALALLDRLQAGAEQGHRQGSLIEVHWLQALAEQSAGNEPAALAALQQAVALAEPEGYVNLFLAEGAAAARLLARAASAGVATDYVNQLRTALASPAGATATGPDILPDPLSDRELEILTLIASGRKNKEIA